MKIYFFETYFWSKFLSRTNIFRFFLDLLEDSHCNLQWESSSKSKKTLKMLVRDENFNQKYVSNFFLIFLFCIYFPSVHTTSFSSQLHPPRRLEQNFDFPPLNHPLYYRAPAGVSPIFGATLPGSSELISWTEKSDDQFFLFSDHD